MHRYILFVYLSIQRERARALARERERARARARERERERERERGTLSTGPTRLSGNSVRYLVDADAFVEAGVVAGVGEVDVS